MSITTSFDAVLSLGGIRYVISDVIVEIRNPVTDTRIMASGISVELDAGALTVELETAEAIEVTLDSNDVVVDVGIDTQTIVLEISKEEEVAEFTVLIDEVDPTPSGYSAVTYIGEAVPGTATSASTWRIKRIGEYTVAGQDAEIEWADGVATFTKVWDDRASYSYS